MCVNDQFRKMMDQLTQKCGYMDVKQSSRVRGRKLKTWRRRWVVFTKMNNMSSDEVVGKMDLYESEEKWKTTPSNKVTFILEHVTAVNQSTSRTHPHAFEIVEDQPTIVLSGTTELESYSWLLSFQQIFTPDLVESTKDSYTVSIVSTEDSLKWKLEGEYGLTVSENGVSLIENSADSNVKISWGLSTLIRFTMEKEAKTEEMTVLVIKCGPNSPTGDSTFKFLSDEVKDIIKTIRHYICIALAHKQNNRRVSSNPRMRSISATYSEKNFLNMLDTQPMFHDPLRDRSGSDSSGSTLPVVSPSTNVNVSEYLAQNESYFRSFSRVSNSDLGVLDEVDEQNNIAGMHDVSNDVAVRDSGCGSECLSFAGTDQPSSATFRVKNPNDPGYSVIKDISSRIKSMDEAARISPTVTSPETSSIEKISAHVSEELVLPACMVKTDDVFSFTEEVNSFPDTTTLSTCSLERKDKKKTDPIYHELDKSDRGIEASDRLGAPGTLNRRRSSSTPDLQAFWKKHGFDTDFENVYEELDEHRRSFFTRSPRKVKEIPPALPARPWTITSPTAPKDKDSQPVVRLRKSLVGKSQSVKEKPWMAHSSKNSKTKTLVCHCPHPTKRNNSTKRSTCCECGGKIKNSESTKHWRKNTYDAPTSIKSSSGIRPQTFCSTDNVERNSFLGMSLPASRNNVGSLIDIDDAAAYAESLRRSPKTVTTATRPASRNDPLIGFFLDDEKFDSNPLVTGEYVAKSELDLLNLLTEGPTSGQKTNLNGHQFGLQSLPQKIEPPPLSSAVSPSTAVSPTTNFVARPRRSSMNDGVCNSFLTDPWTSTVSNTSVLPAEINSTQAFESNNASLSFLNTIDALSFAAPFPHPAASTAPLPSSTRSFSHDAHLREDSYIKMTNRKKNVSSPLEPVANSTHSTNSTKPDQSNAQVQFDPFLSIRNEQRAKLDEEERNSHVHGGKEFDFEDDESADNDDIYVRPGRMVTEYTTTDCLLRKSFSNAI